MTFQVALVGTDGVLIGSDRRAAIKSGQSARRSDWQFTAGTKFITKQDESVICAAAGGPQAQTIAQAIINRGEPMQTYPVWCESLKKIAESVPGNSTGDEVLVVRKDVPDLVLLNRDNRVGATSKIEDRICTGVTATSRFLTQHFWERVSVERLKSLALLTLDYAASERGSEVGFGFDLMVLKAGTVRWERYQENDERIRNIREGFQAGVRKLVVAGE